MEIRLPDRVEANIGIAPTGKRYSTYRSGLKRIECLSAVVLPYHLMPLWSLNDTMEEERCHNLGKQYQNNEFVSGSEEG